MREKIGLKYVIITVLSVFFLSFVGIGTWHHLYEGTEATSSLSASTNLNVTHTIILDEQGFEPSELTISLGDSIIFKTTRNTPFWPASSFHPSHEIYPAFDSKKRILPTETWSFTFDKEGSWGFHDHINEHAIGTIHVIASPGEDVRYCQERDSIQEKQSCWNIQLKTILEKNGVREAFSFFKTLYNSEPTIPKACHEWSHTLGKASYNQYKDTGELILIPEASYCGYGYFHSFIAELVKDTGSFEDILTFCNTVENELGADLKGVIASCIHGVGHGTTAWLLEDPENWGEFQKTADAGTTICEQLYSSSTELRECYDGVYNELHLELFQSAYGFDFDEFSRKDDPYWLCHQQATRHQLSCYFEFAGFFYHIFEGNLEEALTYALENTPTIEINGPVIIERISGDWMQFDIVQTSQERNIIACRKIPSFLYNDCLIGILSGFIQHGNPEDSYKPAFAFCNADYLSTSESTYCFRLLLHWLRGYYTTEQMHTACSYLQDTETSQECEEN